MKTRKQRQEEAVARQVLASLRTPEEQLQRLRERGIASGREWARLMGRIESGSGKVNGAHDKHAMRLSEVPKAKRNRKVA